MSNNVRAKLIAQRMLNSCIPQCILSALDQTYYECHAQPLLALKGQPVCAIWSFWIKHSRSGRRNTLNLSWSKWLSIFQMAKCYYSAICAGTQFPRSITTQSASFVWLQLWTMPNYFYVRCWVFFQTWTPIIFLLWLASLLKRLVSNRVRNTCFNLAFTPR